MLELFHRTETSHSHPPIQSSPLSTSLSSSGTLSGAETAPIKNLQLLVDTADHPSDTEVPSSSNNPDWNSKFSYLGLRVLARKAGDLDLIPNRPEILHLLFNLIVFLGSCKSSKLFENTITMISFNLFCKNLRVTSALLFQAEE